MEFQTVVRRRRMIRRFRPDPVPDDLLQRLLDNARHGPSAGFSQGQAFLVLRGEELASFWSIGEHGAPDSVHSAPLVVVPLSCKRVYLDRYAEPDKGFPDRDETRWPMPFWHIDTGMATMLVLLTAVDLGLGAVYFGISPEDVAPFRTAFGVPEDHEPIGAVAIGYGAEAAQSGSPVTRPRRPAADMVHFGRWGGQA